MAASQAEVRKVDNAIIANKDSTPTAAEYKRIQRQIADAKQNADNARGATSGYTTRDRIGEKFGRGGMAAINKQDTQHGKMDMPFKSLKKFGGMKAGGKVKRYEDGGDVDLEGISKIEPEGSFKDAFKSFRAAGDKTFTWRGKSYSTAVAAPNMAARAPAPKSYASATPSDTTNAGAVTGRTDYDKSRPSDAQKEATTERVRDATMTAASMLPAGRVVSGVSTGVKALSAARAARTAEAMEKAAAGTAKQVSTKEAAKDAAYDARRASDMEARFKKGGMMKYAKGGMHKMPNGKMMKNSAMKMRGMKEGGMPMKDGKPAFLMGKKKMMGGGMAKYAGGGGIESRGKTKGTVIRMASGGSVSSASRRGDGIAQRGKTRC